MALLRGWRQWALPRFSLWQLLLFATILATLLGMWRAGQRIQTAGRPASVAISPDGTLAVATFDGFNGPAPLIWDLSGPTPCRLACPRFAALNDESDSIRAAGKDLFCVVTRHDFPTAWQAEVWDLRRDLFCSSQPIPDGGDVACCSLSESISVCRPDERAIQIWSARTNRWERALMRLADHHFDFRIAPDARAAVVNLPWRKKGSLYQDHHSQRVLLPRISHPRERLTFSDDGQEVALACRHAAWTTYRTGPDQDFVYELNVGCWNSEGKLQQRNVDLNPEDHGALQFSSDGKLLVAVRPDRLIFRDGREGTRIRRINGLKLAWPVYHCGSFPRPRQFETKQLVALSHDGSRVLTAEYDTVRVWNGMTGQTVCTLWQSRARRVGIGYGLVLVACALAWAWQSMRMVSGAEILRTGGWARSWMFVTGIFCLYLALVPLVGRRFPEGWPEYVAWGECLAALVGVVALIAAFGGERRALFATMTLVLLVACIPWKPAEAVALGHQTVQWFWPRAPYAFLNVFGYGLLGWFPAILCEFLGSVAYRRLPRRLASAASDRRLIHAAAGGGAEGGAQ